MRDRARGLCVWCREAVSGGEPCYGSDAGCLHAECMRPYLLEQIGELRLAELLGFTFGEQEEEHA